LRKEASLTRLEPLERARGRIARRLKTARSLLIATDFDGTVAAIADHPDRARLHPRARRALGELRARRGVRLAVLSGRRLGDLRPRVRLPGVFLAGSGGLETLEPGGRRRVHVRPDERLPAALRESLRAWCTRFPGAWLEDKGLVLTLHDRDLDARRLGGFAAGVRRRFAPFADRARILRGRRAFEILPGRRGDKADALRTWLRGARAGVIFYFGDDTNDEPVHRLVSRMGGIAVAVGRRVPGARYHLRGVDAVARCLEWLDREWSARLAAARRPAGR